MVYHFFAPSCQIKKKKKSPRIDCQRIKKSSPQRGNKNSILLNSAQPEEQLFDLTGQCQTLKNDISLG